MTKRTRVHQSQSEQSISTWSLFENWEEWRETWSCDEVWHTTVTTYHSDESVAGTVLYQSTPDWIRRVGSCLITSWPAGIIDVKTAVLMLHNEAANSGQPTHVGTAFLKNMRQGGILLNQPALQAWSQSPWAMMFEDPTPDMDREGLFQPNGGFVRLPKFCLDHMAGLGIRITDRAEVSALICGMGNR